MHVPAGARIPMVVIDMSEDARSAWNANLSAFNALARITELTEVGIFPKGTVTLGLAGGRFGLPLDGVIDVTEEIARLEKTLGKLAKELAGLRGRLNNPKFVDSAPSEIIEETKYNLQARDEENIKLKEALERLQELD